MPSATKHTLEGMEKNRFLGRGSGMASRCVALASGALARPSVPAAFQKRSQSSRGPVKLTCTLSARNTWRKIRSRRAARPALRSSQWASRSFRNR